MTEEKCTKKRDTNLCCICNTSSRAQPIVGAQEGNPNLALKSSFFFFQLEIRINICFQLCVCLPVCMKKWETRKGLPPVRPDQVSCLHMISRYLIYTPVRMGLVLTEMLQSV